MTRKICPDCGERDTIYPTPTRKRCANPDCDWSFKIEPVAHEYPTRGADAKCGDIINALESGVSKSCVRKRNCSDGSPCSIDVSGIKQLNETTWMTVCRIHSD